MREYIDAAKVVSRKNLDGRLAARSAAGLPFLLREGTEVHLVPPVIDAPRRARVTSVAMQGDDLAVIGLDAVDDASVAEALIGCHVLICKDDVDEGVLDACAGLQGVALEGWAFEDSTSGAHGVVLRADEMPAQVMLSVRLDGEDAERLVPLVDEFVEEADEEAHVLSLALPQGMFEI